MIAPGSPDLGLDERNSACVHSLDQALAALAADPSLRLVSASAAASHGGAAWWLALVAAAYGDAPHVQDLLDCGQAAGRAMQALRAGQRGLILSPTTPAHAAVRAAAAALGAILLPVRPPLFDLSLPADRRQLALHAGAGHNPVG